MRATNSVVPMILSALENYWGAGTDYICAHTLLCWTTPVQELMRDRSTCKQVIDGPCRELSLTTAGQMPCEAFFLSGLISKQKYFLILKS